MTTTRRDADTTTADAAPRRRATAAKAATPGTAIPEVASTTTPSQDIEVDRDATTASPDVDTDSTTRRGLVIAILRTMSPAAVAVIGAWLLAFDAAARMLCAHLDDLTRDVAESIVEGATAGLMEKSMLLDAEGQFNALSAVWFYESAYDAEGNARAADRMAAQEFARLTGRALADLDHAREVLRAAPAHRVVRVPFEGAAPIERPDVSAELRAILRDIAAWSYVTGEITGEYAQIAHMLTVFVAGAAGVDSLSYLMTSLTTLATVDLRVSRNNMEGMRVAPLTRALEASALAARVGALMRALASDLDAALADDANAVAALDKITLDPWGVS